MSWRHGWMVALLVSVPAWAGITFETASAKGKSTISMEGDQMRVEMHSSDEGPRTVLVDNQSRTLTVLNTATKTYQRLEMARLEAMASQGDGAASDALAKLPPEQRAKVEAALRKAGQPVPSSSEASKPASPGPVKFESLGKKDKAAGYPCEWYRGLRGDKPFVEGCFIPWGAAGLSKADFAPALKTMESMQAVAARFGHGEGGKAEWDKAPGFPGIQTRISDTGEKQGEEKLLSLKHTGFPADHFKVPADFKPAAGGPPK